MSLVFSAAAMGPLQLKNRLVHSSTFECMAAEDGSVTDALIKRYRDLAKGQVGLIIPGHLYTSARGKALPGPAGAYQDELIPGLKQIVEAVHGQGGKIVFQIAHGGRQCAKATTGLPPLAPSGFGRDPVNNDKPQAASQAQIEEIINDFAQAARRVKEAGADGVQLHCAHGYLLNEFLSPFFNRRTDEWGGSNEKRFAIVRRIIEAIQKGLGPDFPILVKINCQDFTPQPGIIPQLTAVYAAWLAELGVAAVEISSGTYYTFHTVRGELPLNELVRSLPFWKRPLAKMMFKRQQNACRFQPLYHLAAAKIIKPALNGVPLMLVGGVRKLSEMETMLESGQADFLSMSRPFIREPFLAKRLQEGKAHQASCISCNKCFAAVFNHLPLRCYVDGLPQE